MSDGLKIRLDRTLCDGFGICAKHAPQYFSLDDWGYASLIGDGTVPEEDRDAVMRALLDCPVHAIIYMGEHRPAGATAPQHGTEQMPPEPEPKGEDNEAISGFVR
ncbi:ferredoxin [Mycobacterium deserti]|uniref:Ferredoxin n=1 Tax=Mycobacterium deserti TaxID=2978347 RepID=A0ABT2MEA1_9MYCO|nr:ferredoxin [Mycobacterium deserti]MCT7660605.1 ferredoxin [Mycobacterium deserti]